MPRAPSPRPSRFRPTLQPLDDRITPALNFAASTFAAGAAPQGVAAADFNGDGRPDIAVANATAGTVSVLLNDTPERGATPVFGSPVPFAIGSGPTALVAGDLNRDGRPDLAAINNAAGTVSVLTNTTADGAPTATFDYLTTLTVDAANPLSVALADFNADGRLDIAVASYPSHSRWSVSIWRNANFGALVPSFAAPQRVLTYDNLFAIVAQFPLLVGDFNGDGRPDFTANLPTVSGRFNQMTNHDSYMLNTTPAGAHTFAFEVIEPTLTPGERAVGDFNGDGVVSGFGYNLDFSAAAADLDGDGRTDMASVSGNAVTVRPNTTPAFASATSFGAAQTFAVGTSPSGLAVADFNADGRRDLVTANSGDGTVSVLLNTSTGGTVTAPSLVAQFGANGVWRYNRTTGLWDQLTGSVATALATAPNGNVVASFGGNGVWYFNPAHGWYKINGYAATALAMDDLGNVTASFPDFGTAAYRLKSGWAVLTTVPAEVLAENGNGTVAAVFAGYGTYKYTPASGWALLSGGAAAALDVAPNGDVVAAFPGLGLYIHQQPITWRQLNPAEVTAVAVDGRGQVAANYPGYGLYQNGVRIPIILAQSMAVDWYGNLTVALTGYGIWEYTPVFGWRQRTANTPTFLAQG